MFLRIHPEAAEVENLHDDREIDTNRCTKSGHPKHELWRYLPRCRGCVQALSPQTDCRAKAPSNPLIYSLEVSGLAWEM